MGGIIVSVITALLQIQTDPHSTNAANDAISRFVQNAMHQLRSLGAVAAAIAFDKIVQNLLSATSQAEDTAFVFENIYGDLSESQAKWAEDFADTYNRSAKKVKDSLAQIQHEMVGFTKAGTDEEKRNIAEMSKTIERAALNLGAFYGLDSKTAINTLLSATQGSDAAMQTFNVGQGRELVQNRQLAMKQLYDEGALNAYSAKSYESLSLYEKSLVNLRAVLNANTQATDALSRSQENYSTMQENLRESLEELRELLGKFFLPTAKKIVDFLTIIVRALNDMLESILKLTDALGITETVVNMLAGAFAVLVGVRVVGWASSIITALRTMITAATGAGAAGAAASGTIAASLGVTLALLAVVYAVIKDIDKFLKGENSTTGTILSKLGIDAEKAKPYLEALRNIILLVTIAMVGLRIATLATGTAMMATPVGWIIAAIAALIAVIVVVIKYWDNIRAKIKQGIDWLHEKISKAPLLAAMLSAIFTGPIGPIIILIRHFDEIKERVVNFFKTVKERLVEFENSIPVWLRLIVAFMMNPIAAIKFLINHIQELRDAAQGFFDWLVRKLNAIPDWMQVLAGPIGWLTLVAEHFDAIKETVQNTIDRIKEFIELVKHPFGGGEVQEEDTGGGNGSKAWNALKLFNLGFVGDAIQHIRTNSSAADLLRLFNLGFITDALKLTGVGNVSGSTMAMAGGTYNRNSRVVNQNITFNQEFKGSEAMEQKISKAAEDSYDSVFDKFTSAVAKLFA